jgi:L-lactate dehydrogenase
MFDVFTGNSARFNNVRKGPSYLLHLAVLEFPVSGYNHVMSAITAGSRIAIIGAGSVGATCAYALLLRPIASEILLVDTDEVRLRAQVQDLSDAAFLSNTKIRASSSVEAGQCNIIVITAGAKSRDDESRRDLIDRNHLVLDNVIRGMNPIRKDAVLLLVSNPVDVLAYFAQKMSGLPHAQVIGSGTFLDSVRLRSAVAEQLQVRRILQFKCTVRHWNQDILILQVADTAVRAYVLGEHGDSQVVCLLPLSPDHKCEYSFAVGCLVHLHCRRLPYPKVLTPYLSLPL